MKVIKKSNICSFRANDKALNDKRIDGLHFITKSGFTFDKESIDKHIFTRKPIIYETQNDETSSYDYTIYNLTAFLKRFPNMIVSLSDYEMALNIKEMLLREGIKIKVSTPVSASTEGDYVEYGKGILDDKDKTNVSKMLELLRLKKKLIIDLDSYKDSLDMEVIDELGRVTNSKDEILLTTWTPKRILK